MVWDIVIGIGVLLIGMAAVAIFTNGDWPNK